MAQTGRLALRIDVDPGHALRTAADAQRALERTRRIIAPTPTEEIGDLVRGARAMRREAARTPRLSIRRWRLTRAANRCTDFARELAERDLEGTNLERTATAEHVVNGVGGPEHSPPEAARSKPFDPRRRP